MGDSHATMAQEDNVPNRRELYKFSPEELRVLKECNYESFYFRSLPLGTAVGALAYYGVKSGYLKASAKWGPWPKVVMAATMGYFVGKLSYQTKCAEKLMTLPNSPLAEALRQRKGKSKIGFQEAFSAEPINLAIPDTTDPRTPADYLQEMRSEDRSYDAPPTAVGLDDSFRPSLDSFSVSEQPLPPPTQSSTSYDDLRRKNREEFEHKRMENYKKMDGYKTNPNPTPAPYRSAPTSQGSQVPANKNAYGDVWEE